MLGLNCFVFLPLHSCGSSGRAVDRNAFKSDTVKVKQEPGTEEDVCSFSGAVKQEKSEDGRRSACMVNRIIFFLFCVYNTSLIQRPIDLIDQRPI